MFAKYILAALSVVFLSLALTGIMRQTTRVATRTWLVVAAIFACVSILFTVS